MTTLTQEAVVDVVNGMSVEAFLHAINEQPFELIDGKRIPKLPNDYGHDDLKNRFQKTVLRYDLDETVVVSYVEVTFITSVIPNWVQGSRIPDVMIFAADRIKAYKEATPNWRRLPIPLVPNMVVEIVSKGDSYAEVDQKARQYLADGVGQVWVVMEETRGVNLYSAVNNDIKHLSENDALDGMTLMPGFSLALRDLFAQ